MKKNLWFAHIDAQESRAVGRDILSYYALLGGTAEDTQPVRPVENPVPPKYRSMSPFQTWHDAELKIDTDFLNAYAAAKRESTS